MTTLPDLRLGALTGRAAQAALADRPVILLPLGSHESHGPDLPMGDYLLAEDIALRIAAASVSAGTPCLVAPVLPFGAADYFGPVPFAIAFGQATFRAVLADMLACLLRNGLDRLIIVNGHGGNSAAIHEVTLALRREHATIIPSLYLWKIARGLLDALPGGAQGRAGHGADPVASIALHLRGLAGTLSPGAPPGRVLGLPVSDFSTVSFRGAAIDMPLDLSEIAPDGVAPGADPGRATAEDGAILARRLVEIGAAFVVHYAKHA